MDVLVRGARDEDKEPVLEFTKDTWEWGDYIKDVWDKWLHDENGKLLVAEVDKKPIGILHISFLPDNSAWLEGLRVHKEYRRRGIAKRLNQKAFEIIRKKGINAVRLVIVSWNKPSVNLAIKLGFNVACRYISFWLRYNFLPNITSDNIAIQVINDKLEIWKRIMKYLGEKCNLIAYRWEWVKAEPDTIEYALQNDIWTCSLVNGKAIIYKVEENRGISIKFIENIELKTLLSFFNYVRKQYNLKENFHINVVLPETHPFAKEFYMLPNYEKETFLIFELKVQ